MCRLPNTKAPHAVKAHGDGGGAVFQAHGNFAPRHVEKNTVVVEEVTVKVDDMSVAQRGRDALSRQKTLVRQAQAARCGFCVNVEIMVFKRAVWHERQEKTGMSSEGKRKYSLSLVCHRNGFGQRVVRKSIHNRQPEQKRIGDAGLVIGREHQGYAIDRARRHLKGFMTGKPVKSERICVALPCIRTAPQAAAQGKEHRRALPPISTVPLPQVFPAVGTADTLQLGTAIGHGDGQIFVFQSIKHTFYLRKKVYHAPCGLSREK